ncbi:MAG TPA: hypothetical protein VMO81_09640 [Aestuariivirgaceae bacterium]|nr:hypothetical protein [Aestuariivirgaceae bacterium]
MSDHQPEHHFDEGEQAQPDAQASQGAATDPHEPDFSRLRLARASLDNAFPQE